MNLKLYMRWAITAILLVAMTGCEKWLDVRPESEVGEGDMFSTEQGFMDALYGVYVSMGKNDLYGGRLPITMDVLGKLFDVRAGNEWEYMMAYNYRAPESAGISDAIYEIVRIFAPNIKDKPDYLSIPYRKGYSNLIDPQLKVKEVFEKILADLEEAKEALKDDVIRTETPVFVSGNVEEEQESEDVTHKNENYYMSSFLSNRKYRMNYYGVLATMARVYLDRSESNDREKAYECAMEIIESGKFRLIQRDDFMVTTENIKKRDALFTDEFIFGVFSTSVDAWYTSYCYPASNFTSRFRLVDVREGIFEGKITDFRYQLVESDPGSYDMLLKKHTEEYENSKQKIRILGLSEMYYIASEIKPEKATILMDSIARYRGITAVINDNTSADERMREIMKEYRKEFLADGQFFFAFKRLAKETFWESMNLGIPREDKVLVLPLPEAEIEYGDRVSEIWK